MTNWLKWGTLGNTKIAYYGEETTSGEAGDSAGKAPVSSKPPPTPKAQSAYWRYQQVGSEAEKGKGKASKGGDSKGGVATEKILKEKIPKGKNPKGKNPKEKIPNEKMPWGRGVPKGRVQKGRVAMGERHFRKLKKTLEQQEVCILRRRRGRGTGGQRNDEMSTHTISGSVRLGIRRWDMSRKDKLNTGRIGRNQQRNA